jgi:hexosaminidase
MRSSQFLGFLGNEVEAVIDLGKEEKISELILHAFEEKDSWIYAPKKVSFYMSNDGKNYSLIENVFNFSGKHNLVFKISVNQTARFVKIIADNFGLIPSGNPGAGNEAWLFVDEIEVK